MEEFVKETDQDLQDLEDILSKDIIYTTTFKQIFEDIDSLKELEFEEE